MEIGAVSSNVFVQQIGGVSTSKQIQNTDQNDDANVTAALESSQNIGENSVRKTEPSSDTDGGSTVSDSNDELNNDNEVGSQLDVLA